jgi:tripartite-type tricarboxylate transporter receptor subunit TctC
MTTISTKLARALVIVTCLLPAWAAAQGFPSRPVRLIVPYPPGGNTDIVARLYGQKLAERIGQPVVIDNRGGAAGTLGLGIAAKSPNDGYTIGVGDLGSMVIARFANPNLAYDPQKDFAPVGLLSTVSIVVTANPKSQAGNFADFLALARAQPGKLTYGTAGVGAAGHLAFELLRSMTKVELLHVPFKGGAQAVTALLGEQVDVVVDGAAFAQVKAGKLKALAVTGPRLPALPDVAGIGETVPGFSFTNWWGILAPAGTPPEAIGRLNEELRQIAATPEVAERLSGLGLAAQGSTPQQFADHVRTETDKIGRIVREAGLKFE